MTAHETNGALADDRFRIYWLALALTEIKADLSLYRQLLAIPHKTELAQSVLDNIVERIDTELSKDCAPEAANVLLQRYFERKAHDSASSAHGRAESEDAG